MPLLCLFRPPLLRGGLLIRAPHSSGHCELASQHCYSTNRRRTSGSSPHTRPRKRIVSDDGKWPTTDNRAWVMRLAHENSYLSWSRNAAICAGIAATMRIIETQSPTATDTSSTLITGFSDLGLVFIAYGSCHHLYQAVNLRRNLKLSNIELFWVCAYTLTIGSLYYFLIQTKF